MAEIVTLAEFKAYLDVGHADDDTRIAVLCARATADIQLYTRRPFTEITAGAVAFCDGGQQTLIVPGLPIIAVAEIADMANGAAALDLGLAEIQPGAGLISRRQSGVRVCWPGIYQDRRWRVTYSFGYAEPPADVKGVAYDMIASRYERPDATQTSRKESDLQITYGELWPAMKAALSPYRTKVM